MPDQVRAAGTSSIKVTKPDMAKNTGGHRSSIAWWQSPVDFSSNLGVGRSQKRQGKEQDDACTTKAM
ncbi:hypothetical protein NL676_025993 [Syzygium grande]|nr:hypothetical protein NL676_025993 [Syzygium grande]